MNWIRRVARNLQWRGGAVSKARGVAPALKHFSFLPKQLIFRFILIKIEISVQKQLNWLHKWALAMWEVANGKISVLLFTSWYRKIIDQKNSQGVIHFCLYLIEKNSW